MGQFVNAGLKRITEIFREWDPLIDNVTHNDLKKCASEILRLLANIVAPFRKDASLPPIETPVQDTLFTVLCARIANMTAVMKNLIQRPWEVEASRGTQAIIFMARVLQFYLGLPIVWSQQSKDPGDDLCRNLTRLALVRTFIWSVYLHQASINEVFSRCTGQEKGSTCSCFLFSWTLCATH